MPKKETEHLLLDLIKVKDVWGKLSTLVPEEGLAIYAKLQDEDPEIIAYIRPDKITKNCYIRTVTDRLQTYICDYPRFCEFIELVDLAYDTLNYEIPLNENIKAIVAD